MIAFGEGIAEFFWRVLLTLVMGLYNLVSYLYQIFLVLAKTNIFKEEMYTELTEKVYVILAVVMLFIVAYNFITLIVDPDKNKGGQVVEKLIKKVVISLILIVLCPTLFSLAFEFQDSILNQGIITKFFTVEDETTEYDPSESIKKGGYMMAGRTFAAFFTPALESVDTVEVKNMGTESPDGTIAKCSQVGQCTLEDAIEEAADTGKLRYFYAFVENIVEGDNNQAVELNFLVSLFAGGYLVYVILSFCFDLAIRVVKLAFYQIIAPICIACNMLPNKDSIFKNWWKAVYKTYLSVFIRIFIMNLVVFLLTRLAESDAFQTACGTDCSLFVDTLATAFLIMGLLMFAKQSSKLIDEIFGLGDVKLGITDKLKEGGAFAAGAAIGATGKGLLHGGYNAVQNTRSAWKTAASSIRNNRGANHAWWGNTKAVAKGVGSTVGGIFGAGTRGVSAGLSSLSASTNSFGMAALKGEYEKMKDQGNQAVKDADIKALNRKDSREKWFGEAGIIRGGHAIKELKEEIKRKAELKELNDKLKLALDAEVEVANATARLNQDIANVVSSTRTDAEKRAEIARLNAEFNTNYGEKQQLALEKDDLLNRYKAAYEALYEGSNFDINRTNDEIKAALSETNALLANDINVAETKLSNTRRVQWQEDIEAKVMQTLTGVDKSRTKQLVTQYNDDIKNTATKVINKHASEITVSLEGALKKQTALSAHATTIADLYREKSVQEINAIASQLNIAQDADRVKEILGTEVANQLGINSSNFIQIKGAFINAIQEPYQKDVNKAVTDAITSNNTEFTYKTGDSVDIKLFKDNKAAGNVLGDLDSTDVRRKQYAYNVLTYEIYGDTVYDENGKKIDLSTSAGRKSLEDALRKQTAPDDRRKSVGKIMDDVKSVNTKGDKK